MDISDLAPMILRRRGNMGIRAAAKEIGISPTTLSRIEKGHVPDVGTLDKISDWLGEELTKFTGLGGLQIAFKNRKTAPMQTAKALATLIQKASEQFSDQLHTSGH